MLVIISDLHLTDGTSGQTIREGAFRAFRERLRDLAYDASWRADGRYRPVEEVHVVLLGDILDVIRSTRWLENKVRPWDTNPYEPRFVKKVEEITATILEDNAASIGILASLSQKDIMTLPPATKDGKPAQVGRAPNAKDRVPVETRLHYLVGNHDWFYHLPGKDYNKIREQIVQAMGLANSSSECFPHDPDENKAVSKFYEDHGVFARHGDIYDPFNFSGDRNQSSLGDAIVVEVLNRFPSAVENELGKILPTESREGLKEIDNVRPHTIIPVWIDGLLRRTCPDPKLVGKVKDIWDNLADSFLQLPFVQSQDSPFNPWDSVDQLQYALKFSKGISLATAGRILQVVDKWDPRRKGYLKYALSETAFKNRTARHLVYGHTHHYEIIPLDTTYTSTGIFNQIYVNSGTWRRVHELARHDPDQQEFVSYKVMTYVAFFKDDERRGKTFESWSGALGE